MTCHDTRLSHPPPVTHAPFSTATTTTTRVLPIRRRSRPSIMSNSLLTTSLLFVWISSTNLFPHSSLTNHHGVAVTAVSTANSFLSLHPKRPPLAWDSPTHPMDHHSHVLQQQHYHQRQRQKNEVLLQTLRGGATLEDDDDEEEMDDDDDDDDLSLDFDDDDDLMNSVAAGGGNEFDEITMVDRLVTSYQKTPPFTKLYLSISLAITMYGYLFQRNEFPSVLLLQWEKVVTRLQIWRLVTSFFHFGPFGLGYIMTLQFVWVYMSTLERIHHNKPYDFWIMILFGQLCMVIGYPIMKLSPKFLGHNLSTFLVYIWSRYHEGVEVSMFELFNTRAEMLPWFFLGQTFLLEGEIPILDFLGIVFGHIYHHCKTVGILRAPTSIVQWYETSDAAQRIRELYKPISSEFDAQ